MGTLSNDGAFSETRSALVNRFIGLVNVIPSTDIKLKFISGSPGDLVWNKTENPRD
ncbi:MAG: hypothetical protein JMDDDDMK_04093 [Acidobacteria bacterium]|nr:hypothetical protein [Acidobacteriota bacterium]